MAYIRPLSPIPRYLTLTILMSFLTFTFGYDTGSIGPITSMGYFRLVMGEFTPTVHGAIVSSSLITGAISASLAGVLADKYGRVRMSIIGVSIDGVGAAIMCGSPVLGVFILGRLIKGLGDGLFLSAVYVQVSEMSPARYRGILSSIPQFNIVSGLICGYFVCYGTSEIQSTLSWRLPLAIISALAFVFSILACFVPPSPRWLLARGEVDRSRSIATSLGIGQEEIDELFGQPASSLESEMNATLWESVLHLVKEFQVAFSKPYRSRTVFGCALMAFQQLAGIDGVLYYAPQMFQSAGLTSTEASFLASGVSGLVIFGVTIPACLLADSVKRRTSALTGGVGVTVVMFTMAILYAAGQVHGTHGAARWVVIVCIYLFAIIFNGTWGLTLRIYLVESMPMRTRSSASSLGQSSNWMANYFVALITPTMLAASPCIAYFFFGGMTFVATIGIYFWMVETKGASLESIEDSYDSTHVLSHGKEKDTPAVTVAAFDSA